MKDVLIGGLTVGNHRSLLVLPVPASWKAWTMPR
jgi:hypothetical protein